MRYTRGDRKGDIGKQSIYITLIGVHSSYTPCNCYNLCVCLCLCVCVCVCVFVCVFVFVGVEVKGSHWYFTLM